MSASGLIEHAVSDCKDPDCEIHRIEVGRAELTVSDTDLAFFLAGATRVLQMLREDYAMPLGLCEEIERRIKELNQ